MNSMAVKSLTADVLNNMTAGEAALNLATTFGLRFLPLCPPDHQGVTEQHRAACNRPGKVPRISKWVTEATNDPDVISEWFQKWPNSNLGMLTGSTEGIIVIDVDGRYGRRKLHSLFNGNIPVTWHALTPNGERFFFKVPTNLKLRKYTDSSPEGGHEELAVLVDGNQTVVPPSTNAQGVKYEWVPGRGPADVPLAETPEALLKLVSPTQVAASLSEDESLAEESTPEEPGGHTFGAHDSAPFGRASASLHGHKQSSTGDSVLDKLSNKCEKVATFVSEQYNGGCDEDTWYKTTSMLVHTGNKTSALFFSKLSKKHNAYSVHRIERVEVDRANDKHVPTRCTTFGCGAEQLKACFGHVTRDKAGDLLGSPGWHLTAKPGARTESVSAEETAWEAVRKVKEGKDDAAHLSEEALQAFNEVWSQNPAEYAKMELQLKNAKVSVRSWNQARKAVKEKQIQSANVAQQQALPPFEEIGMAINPTTGGLGRFNANIFAAHFGRKFDLGVKVSQEKVYRYEAGVWKPLTMLEVCRLMRDYLHAQVAHCWTPELEKLYLPALLREAEPLGEFDVERGYVNLLNGMLNLSTMAVVPHDKRFHSTIQVGIAFDPGAPCEHFVRFLSEVFEDDHERIALVQEMFGYCLTAETRAHKAFFLYGVGRNGKSVLLDVLTALVGRENCSAVPLAELENDFARSDLYGKTVNLATENEVDPRGINTQYFKTIVGGDVIRANVKYEKAFNFRPTVKMVFAANNLPFSRDRSSGFLQRLIVIPFKRQFLGSKADKRLTETLLQELPGVLNWALEGLNRLRSNGYVFTHSKAVDTALEEFKANLSPVFAFLGECFRVNPDGRASHKAVRDAYTKWCRLNGHETSGAMSHKKFWDSFRTACREKLINISPDKSNGVDQVVGVTLKTERYWSNGVEQTISGSMEELFREDDEVEAVTAVQHSVELPQEGDVDTDILSVKPSEVRVFEDDDEVESQNVRETYLYLAAKVNDPSLNHERWQDDWDGDISRCPPLSVTVVGTCEWVRPSKVV